MKTIKKIKFINTFGISELTLEPAMVNIIQGKKGTGKTSVLDSINASLSNRNIRADIVKKGETEATMVVELSDGTVIDRTKSLEKSDTVKVKENGLVVSSPESYLKSLFTSNQFRPIEFVESSTKDQNKVLLSLIEITWTMDDIKQWFGEIPEGINYDEHILNILDAIQAKNGKYFLTREDINRDIRSKQAIAKDIARKLPDGYQAEKWREVNLGELYSQVTKAQTHNNTITEKKLVVSEKQNRLNDIDNELEIEKQGIDAKLNAYMVDKAGTIDFLKVRISMLQKEIADCESSIKEAKTRAEDLKVNADRVAEEKKKSVEQMASMIDLVSLEEIDTLPLMDKANEAEKMKSFLNEYDSMMDIYNQIAVLQDKSILLTEKIEKARMLPGELLKQVKSPIAGLTVESGVPLINGLPIQNLSTGEQLELSVEIAKKLVGELGVILVDRLESLDTESQDNFLKACKESGLQFFCTKVSDTEYEIKSV